MRKKGGLGVLVFTILFGLIAVEARGQGYPHFPGGEITCTLCHDLSVIDAPSLPPFTQGPPSDIDDTPINRLCWSCHDDVTAPFVNSHSSLQIDNSYGDWAIECTGCHNPHNQQSAIYGSESYLHQGISTNVTSSTITEIGAEWMVDQFQDMVVIPNIAAAGPTYKILSNTSDTLNVEGPIDLTQVNTGDTFAIAYGQLIRDAIITPYGETKITKFYRPTGPKSFADGDMTYDGVCEACHTLTTFHRNNNTGDHTHNAGLNCAECHLHVDGFAATGVAPAAPHDSAPFINNCDYCHVTPTDFVTPIPDSKCEQCHTEAGALKGSFPTAPNVVTHNSANGSGKYVYDNTCVDCHNPMFEQTNLKLIRSQISGSIITGSNIVFTSFSGLGSFADGPPYHENLCNTCHSMTNHQQFDGTAPGGQDHNNGEDCLACHPHTDGFLPMLPVPVTPHNSPPFLNSCELCHVSPTDFTTVIPNSKCDQCHTAGGSLRGSFPTAPIVVTHKWRDCVGCHEPMFGSTNLALLRTDLFDVGGGTNIVFTSRTGTDSFADGPPYIENVCNTCHFGTNHHQRDGTAPGGQDHNNSTDCTVCHAHSDAFTPFGAPAAPHDSVDFSNNCDLCHVSPTDFVTPVPDSKCNQCHTPAGSLKGSYPTAPDVLTHQGRDCAGCHQLMTESVNLKLVKTDLSAVGGGINIVFTARTGNGSFADGPPYIENVCNTCHFGTNHHQRDGTAPGGQDHNNGADCAACHPHGDAFLPTGAAVPPPHDVFTDCTVCHVGPTDFTTPIPDSKCQGCHDPSAPGSGGFNQVDDFGGLTTGDAGRPNFGSWTGVDGSDGTNGWMAWTGATDSAGTGPSAGNPGTYVVLESSASGSGGGGAGIVTRLGSWSTNVSSGTGAANLTYSVPAGSDRALVVVVSAEDSGQVNITGATYGGQALTLIDKATQGTGYSNQTWAGYCDESCIAAASGTTIAASFSGSHSTGMTIGAATYEGVDQASPIADFNSSNTSSNTISVNVINPEGGMVFYGVEFNGVGGNSISPPSGFTEMAEMDTTGNGFRSEIGERNSTTAATVTVNPSNTGTSSNRTTMVAAALNPASGSGGAPHLDLLDDFSGAGDEVLLSTPTSSGWTTGTDSNSSSSDCWFTDTNTTRSNNTGETAGNPTPYVYVEASTSSSGTTCGNYNAGDAFWLESPDIDGNAYTSLSLSFDYNYESSQTSGYRSVDIYYRNGTGGGWTLLQNVISARRGTTASWASTGPIELRSVLSQPGSRVRIQVTANSTNYEHDIVFDNIALTGNGGACTGECDANGVNVTAGSEQYLVSNVIDASIYALNFRFDWNMNVGDNTDASLHLDAWNGSTWNLDITGGAINTDDNGDIWVSEGPVDLSTYTNTDFQLRIRYIVGNGTIHQNDVAVDNLTFTGAGAGSGSDLKVRTHGDSVNAPRPYTYNNACVDCHNPMFVQPNLKFIRPTIAASVLGGTIEFTALSGPGSFADGSPYRDNICDTCHSQTQHHQADGTAPGSQSHNDSTNCEACHPHSEGFQPQGGCVGCHSQQLGAGRRDVVNNDLTKTSHHIQAPISSLDDGSCIQCHGDLIADRNHPTAATPDQITELQDPDTGTFITVNGAGAPSSELTTFCVNCHDADGVSRSFGNGTTPFSDSGDNMSPPNVKAEWNLTFGHRAAGVECMECHGDSGGDGSTLAPFMNGHGSDTMKLLQYTYDPNNQLAFCEICHGDSGTSNWGTNVTLEFNTSNNARHPIGTPISDNLPAMTLLNGWGSGDTMTCSDCHDTAGGAQGPHGSSVKWMLTGTNKAWPYDLASLNGSTSTNANDFRYLGTNRNSNFGSDNGLFCRNCHAVEVMNNEVHAKGDESGDHHDLACVACHIRVPHGGLVSRFIAATGVNAYPGNLPTRLTPNGAGLRVSGSSLIIREFRQETNPNNYDKDNCYTNAGNGRLGNGDLENCDKHNQSIANGESW